MKIMVYIFSTLFLPFTVAGQRSTPLTYQAKADSIITYFLGKEVVQQYVRKSSVRNCRVDNENDSRFFGYSFTHPKFSKKLLIIELTLDLKNQVDSSETCGLIKIDSADDAKWISADDAMKICKEQAYRLKKRSLRLTCDATNASYNTYKKTHNFRDIIPGDLAWEIDGVVKFRGDYYSGTFQVNIFTGVLTKRFAIPWD